MAETTALGAALAAGCAKGIDLFDLDAEQCLESDQFHPKINEEGKKEAFEFFSAQIAMLLSLFKLTKVDDFIILDLSLHFLCRTE